MCTNYIIENIDDEELKKLFARIRIQQKELSYIEDGINSKYEDIQKSIESRKKHENFKREYELIIFVKERVTTVIKNMPGGSIEPA